MSVIKVRLHVTDRLGRKIHVIEGNPVAYRLLTTGDLTDKVTEAEQYLSRILGMEVKIETATQ